MHRCQNKEHVNLWPKFLGKHVHHLVKIISDGENNFTQNKYKKLQKMSAKNKWFFANNKCKSVNMGSSTVLIEIQIQNLLWKLIFYIIQNECE